MKNYLRRIRQRRGLSQAGISRLTGIHPSTISRIETGVIRGGRKLRQQIARALKAEVSEIFPESGDGKRWGTL